MKPLALALALAVSGCFGGPEDSPGVLERSLMDGKLKLGLNAVRAWGVPCVLYLGRAYYGAELTSALSCGWDTPVDVFPPPDSTPDIRTSISERGAL